MASAPPTASIAKPAEDSGEGICATPNSPPSHSCLRTNPREEEADAHSGDGEEVLAYPQRRKSHDETECPGEHRAESKAQRKRQTCDREQRGGVRSRAVESRHGRG